jgi:hypothetical protein
MPLWTDYSLQTTPDDADTLLAHDVSETTVGQKMKRTTWANIKAAILGGTGHVNVGVFTLTVPATGAAALLGTANVFTDTQNLPTYSLVTGWGGFIQGQGLSLNANDAIVWAEFLGMLLISNVTDDTTQLIICSKAGSFTSVASQGLSCTLGSDAGGTLSVYHGMTGTNIYIKNRYGVTKTIRVQIFGNNW